jgi:hypothetical protein
MMAGCHDVSVSASLGLHHRRPTGGTARTCSADEGPLIANAKIPRHGTPLQKRISRMLGGTLMHDADGRAA